MFGGLVGMTVSDSGLPDASGQSGKHDQLSPTVGWGFFTVKE